MIASLLLTAQLGSLPPNLELLTPPQAGTNLVYEMTGTLDGVPEFLLIDFTLLPFPVSIPPFGDLQLALTPLLAIIPGDGSHQFAVPVPSDSNLAGLVVHAQGFGFVFNGQTGNNKLTNLVSATLTAPDPQPRFLFSGNFGDRTLSKYLIDGETGQLRHGGVRLLDFSPRDLAATPTGDRLFVLSSPRIEGFVVDATDGALAPIPGPTDLAAGVTPGDMTLTPGGNRLYLTDNSQDLVWGWGIDATGILSPLTGSPWNVIGSGAGSQGSQKIAIDAQGRFLCVLNPGSDTLSVFEIEPSGALTNERTVGVAVGPSALTTLYQDDPDPVLIVTSSGVDAVEAFRLSETAAPASLGQVLLAAGANPNSVRAARFLTDDRVFVTNSGTNSVDRLTLDAQGQLSAPTTVLNGAGPIEIELGGALPNAFVLYGSESEISAVSLDSTSGNVAPIAPATSPIDRVRTRDIPIAIELVNGEGFASFATDRVYTVTRSGQTVDQFDFDADQSTVSPLIPASANTTGQPNGVAVHPLLDFLYAGNFLQGGGADLEVYDISIQGAASKVQTLDLDGSGTSPVWGVDVDPTGSLVIASIANIPGRIVPLRIGPGGSLTELTAVNAGNIPRGGAIDPTGRFYYVADSLDARISQFELDAAAGTLTALTPSTVTAAAGVLELVCDPTGRYLYSANSVAGTVGAYAIDHANGRLTALAGSPVSVGTRPAYLAVDPGGRHLIVADESLEVLHRMEINLDTTDGTADGLPVAIGQTPIAAQPRGLRFSSEAEHLFVSIDDALNPDSLLTFDFDAVTGTLAFTDSDPTGEDPREIATRDRIE